MPRPTDLSCKIIVGAIVVVAFCVGTVVACGLVPKLGRARQGTCWAAHPPPRFANKVSNKLLRRVRSSKRTCLKEIVLAQPYQAKGQKPARHRRCGVHACTCAKPYAQHFGRFFFVKTCLHWYGLAGCSHEGVWKNSIATACEKTCACLYTFV